MSQTEHSLERIYRQNNLHGMRVILVDPDDRTGRTRNEYEDCEEDELRQRLVVCTLYPERAKGAAHGDPDAGVVVMSHEKAVTDIRKMIGMGYRLLKVERDLKWE